MSWLFGHRFAVVTYKGRRSDRTCRTVLWVYRYLPDTGAITVVSVWGDSDWLRNIRSKPATLIQAGRNGFVAGQQFLGTGQIVALVKAFRRDHRWIAPGQARLMRWPWPATDEQLRTVMRADAGCYLLTSPSRSVRYVRDGARTEGEIIIVGQWTWCAEEIISGALIH